jgi:hypothetical protein
MDRLYSEVNCNSIDGILCDYYSQVFRALVADSSQEEIKAEENSRVVVIQQKLYREGITDKIMMEAV